ncbi:uncharacterized protein EKO05_0011023 [Ascochyta rabiei]|uniref:uncharacterized protein n=1 Tax=Didymella rabiei TaxID=5454 RepID=UPI0022072BFF|nr:uncharacterized protein EKO05_0011023 [Ascochyta rabiei]UPX20803.1 hypothetical protein EKO05_0011023 [Ascochyta rabiei]
MTGPALFRSNTQHPRPLGRGVLRVKQPGSWRSERSNQKLLGDATFEHHPLHTCLSKQDMALVWVGGG